MSYNPAPHRPVRPPRGQGHTRLLATTLFMFSFVGVLWLIEVIDMLSANRLDSWGISPRDPRELPDIVTAPFLHAGFGHLAANTAPLLILGFIAALRGIGRFIAVSAVIVVVSGLGVWLTSWPNTITLGASGLIFGYFGYVVLRGFIDRNLFDIVVGVIIALVYGSLLWGLLPIQAGVSWQAHLFGLIGGALAAWIFRAPRPRVDRPPRAAA